MLRVLDEYSSLVKILSDLSACQDCTTFAKQSRGTSYSYTVLHMAFPIRAAFLALRAGLYLQLLQLLRSLRLSFRTGMLLLLAIRLSRQLQLFQVQHIRLVGV
jgi:hypothetical protein